MNHHYNTAQIRTHDQIGALNRIAEALLAVAYEQRTANLIAYAEMIPPPRSAPAAEAAERLQHEEH